MRYYLFTGGLLLLLLTACHSSKPMQPVTITHAFRLLPGQDLKQSIELYVKQHQIAAGWIATAVGSLTEYQVRFANQEKTYSDKGHFEIVSLVGTVSVNGSHLHVSLSDSTGKTIGGHLMDGCKIYTTAEIVIGESKEHVFNREKDGSTPWEELQVKPAKQ